MIVLRFRTQSTVTLPDDSDPAMIEAARRLMLQLAAQIVQAVARAQPDGGPPEPE